MTTWRPHGDQIGTTWETSWGPHGDQMGKWGNEKQQPSKEAEAIQLEPFESSKDEVNGASQPTANREESFLVTAAVCSTWIPSVVGRQEQKIFLKVGIASLVTKTTFLAIPIGLSSFGYNLHPRPKERTKASNYTLITDT